jgi:hypothetical protein
LNKRLVEVLDFAWLTFFVRSAVEVDMIEPELVVAVVVVAVVDIVVVVTNIVVVVTNIVVVEVLLEVAEATSCRIDSYVLPG